MQQFELILSGGQAVNLTTDELMITEEQAYSAALSIALNRAHFPSPDWHVCRMNIGGEGDVFGFFRQHRHSLEIELCPEGSDLFSVRIRDVVPEVETVLKKGGESHGN